MGGNWLDRLLRAVIASSTEAAVTQGSDGEQPVLRRRMYDYNQVVINGDNRPKIRSLLEIGKGLHPTISFHYTTAPIRERTNEAVDCA
jgi:hypothetical protein